MKQKSSKEDTMLEVKAPNLKEYAERLGELSPFIGDFVTVDREAIRLFIGPPKYKNERWVASEKGRETLTVYIDGAGYLNGIVDLEYYLDFTGQIDYKRAKIDLA